MRTLVGAPIDPALAHEVLSVAKRIRSGELTAHDAPKVIEVISRMTTQTMNHFFVRPVDIIHGGMTMKSIAQFGVSGATRGICFGLGKILPRLKPAQWKHVADFLEESLHKPDTPKK